MRFRQVNVVLDAGHAMAKIGSEKRSAGLDAQPAISHNSACGPGWPLVAIVAKF
jgi:hypothetical protein